MSGLIVVAEHFIKSTVEFFSSSVVQLNNVAFPNALVNSSQLDQSIDMH